MKNRWDQVSIALLVGIGLVTAILYSRLPALVPTHFGIQGYPNAWMDRPLGAWLMPVIAVATWAFVRFGSGVLPSEWRARFEASPRQILGALLAGLFSAMHLVVLYVTLNPGMSAAGPFGVALGVFWVLLGQVLPRVRRNPLLGVRTTWTITSDENWARTHRFAGWTFTIGGLVAAMGGFVGATWFPLAAMALSAVAPAIYSFLLARQLAKEPR